MARVTGPFMSLDASGTLAHTLTASKWKGRNYMRQRVIPNNPKSAAQSGVRAMMSFLSQHWAAMSAPDKATYEAAAEAKQISPFNEYVSANLLRWQQNGTPTEEWPAPEAATPLTLTSMVLTGFEGYATAVLTPSAGTDIGGFIVYRALAEITAPNWAQVVAVIEADGANAVTFTDSPLEAETYHYRAQAFCDDGIAGTVIADDTVVVT